MSTVHVFVSTGKFRSAAGMRKYVDERYDDDGGGVPSAFMTEVRLASHEPACIELVYSRAAKPIAKLLRGVSYAEQWLSQLDPSISASEAICVFAPNKVRRPEGSSLTYCGCFRYRAST